MKSKIVGGLFLYAGGALIGGGLAAIIFEIVEEIRFRKMVAEEANNRPHIFIAGGEKIVVDLAGIEDAQHEIQEGDVPPDEEEIVDERNEAAFIKSQIPSTKKLKGGRNKEEDEQKIDYTKFQKDKGDLEDLASKYKSSIIPEVDNTPPQTYPDHPFVISFDDYTAAQGMQVYVRLSYYAGDDVLTEDTGERVADPAKLLGPDWKGGFDGDISGDPDIVYVRNFPLGFDYEVSRIRGTYKHIVLGIVEEPIAQTPHKSKSTRRSVRNNPPRRPMNEEEDED